MIMNRTLPLAVAIATCLGAANLQGQAPQPGTIPPPPPPNAPAPSVPGQPPTPNEPPRPESRKDERRKDRERDRDRGRDRDHHRKDREHARFPGKPRPYLGVVTAPVPPAVSAQLGLPEGFGLLVENVLPESPAEKAGVQEHDILKLYNDQQLVEPGQLATLVHAAGKDAQATLTVIRKGEEQKLTLTIGERVLPEAHPFMDFRRRMHDFGGTLQEHARDLQDEAREQQRRARRSFEELRERMRERRDAEIHAKPSKDVPPGAGPHAQEHAQSSVNSTASSKARVTLKDQDGEIEVVSEDGNRTLTAKDAKGETVFNGPINTPEQLKAVPEKFREKLERVKVSQSGTGISIGSAPTDNGPGPVPNIQ